MPEKLFAIYLQCVCTELAKYLQIISFVGIDGRVKQGQASVKSFLKFNELFCKIFASIGLNGRYISGKATNFHPFQLGSLLGHNGLV